MSNDPQLEKDYDKQVRRTKRADEDRLTRNCMRLFIWSAVLFVFCFAIWNIGSGGIHNG